MSDPWTTSTQLAENSLDSTLPSFSSLDLLEHLDPVEPVLDITSGTLSMPSDTTFDWSSSVDPTLLLLSEPDDFVIETPPGVDISSNKPASDEQSLREAILQLGYSLEARIAQIEDSLRLMDQRLTKVEDAKEAQDIEMQQRKEQIRTESKKLLDDIREYHNLMNLTAKQLVRSVK
ncbi:uncharacterized protein PV09_09777 [Verruconis gallopava]|uniref:Uncharacterized protein n=1 Tax=Verruconis gallopava TaxID=253628 RepID=A0A0D1ZWI1_9PEZI|nr:uncharacterized protein PV09_09777 [Verruconis gallopava]KIV98394.1 hypothetical protein PV09_09777 [Verruconis gallopava]